MILSPGARKFALTAHVVASVGWLGSVGAFLALAVTGRSSGENFAVRASYAAMEPVTWYAIVPLSFASLLRGLVQALGTSWGLIRHYWVVAKLLLTLLATLLLLVHTQPIGLVAAAARAGELAPADLRGLRIPAPVRRRRGAAGAGHGDGALGLQAARPNEMRPAETAAGAFSGVGRSAQSDPYRSRRSPR